MYKNTSILNIAEAKNNIHKRSRPMSIDRYHLATEASQNTRSAPRLLYVTSAKYEGDWECNPHNHTCAEIFFVVSGAGSFVVDGQSHPVEKNSESE